MTTLALLLCSLTMAVEPTAPPAAPPDGPPAPATAPTTGPAAGEQGPPAAPPPSGWTFGLEALVPRKTTGRLLEQPLALAVETVTRLGGPFEGAIRFSLGYAELSRTDACQTSDCWPAAAVSLGAGARLTTAPRASVVGWIGLGAGLTGAGNWDLNAFGVYGRADAGLDLAVGTTRRLRLSVGWVEEAFTEDAPEREPGHQQYLAITLALGSR